MPHKNICRFTKIFYAVSCKKTFVHLLHIDKCCAVSRMMMSLLAAALLVARLAAAEPHSELAEGDNPCVDK